MKKHIKKIICLVAVLVLCVSAFVIPTFAMYVDVDDTNDVYELIGVQPIVTVNYYDDDISHLATDTVMTAMPFDALSVYGSTIWDSTLYSATTSIPTCVYKGYSIGRQFQNVDLGVTIEFPAAEIDHGYTEFPMPYIDDIYSLVLENKGWRCHIVARYYDAANNLLKTYDNTINGNANTFRPYDTVIANAPSVAHGHSQWETIFIEKIVFEVDAITNQRLMLVIPYAERPPMYTAQIGWLAPQNISSRYTAIHVNGNDFDFGNFLWESVEGFMSIELVDGIPLYVIFSTVVAVPLFIWFLKLLAGG